MSRHPESETQSLETESHDDLGVQDFLVSFGRALTAGDGAAIAEMWETPAFVLGEGMCRVIDTREDVEQFFGGARDQYNALGIVDTHPQIVRLDDISDRIVMVRVRWPYLDAQDRECGAETSTYTLAREDSGDDWKFRIVVMQGTERLN